MKRMALLLIPLMDVIAKKGATLAKKAYTKIHKKKP